MTGAASDKVICTGGVCGKQAVLLFKHSTPALLLLQCQHTTDLKVYRIISPGSIAYAPVKTTEYEAYAQALRTVVGSPAHPQSADSPAALNSSSCGSRTSMCAVPTNTRRGFVFVLRKRLVKLGVWCWIQCGSPE